MIELNDDLEQQSKITSHVPNVVPAPHCVTILFPALSDDTQKAAKSDPKCSSIERHAFALVLLACSLEISLGEHGRLRIVACEPLTSEMLEACAHLLSLSVAWARIVPKLSRFNSNATLNTAMALGNFVQTPLSTHSLFLVTHADSKRVRFNFGKTKVMLSTQQTVDVIHLCAPEVVHVMVCKAKALVQNLRQTSVKSGKCLASVWIGYGKDDITTVPFDFGSPLSPSTNWLNMAPDFDIDEGTYTHITASVQGFLCSLSVGYGYSLDHVIRSVKVPNHDRNRVSLSLVTIEPECEVRGQISELFPPAHSLSPILAHVGVSWAKYRWWLQKLELSSGEEFNFL